MLSGGQLGRGWDKDAVVDVENLAPEQKGVMDVRPLETRELGGQLRAVPPPPPPASAREGKEVSWKTQFFRDSTRAVPAAGNACASTASSAARAGSDAKGPSSVSRLCQLQSQNKRDTKLVAGGDKGQAGE